ncbi:hypothetical protein HAX54_046635, partial [Datura stramonium]|nr:hypothetical protein [Datura stramonium]
EGGENKMKFDKCINVDQEEEEEDRLSFRDLPIYSNAKEIWENYDPSEESHNYNISTQDEGLFEFFNQEWIKNQFFHHQDIIFCGKIIHQEKPIEDIIAEKSRTDINPHKLKNKRKIGDYITFFRGDKKGLRS